MQRFLVVLLLTVIWGGAATTVGALEPESWESLTKKEQSFIKANPTLKVLVNSALPPYTFMENDELQGYWIDLLHMMFKDLPIELRFQTRKKKVDFGKTLAQRKVDIHTSILERPYRKKEMLFSIPVVSFGLPIIITNSNKSPLNSISSLTNKKIASMKGHPFERKLLEVNSSIIAVEAQSLQNALEMVSYGLADATLQDVTISKYFIDKLNFNNLRQTGVASFPGATAENACFAVAKDRPALQMLLNTLLTSIDQKKINQLRDKWGVVDIRRGVSATLLTNSEKKWVQKLRSTAAKLAFCTPPDWMPMGMIKEGQYIGMVADILYEIESQIDIPMTLIPTNSWNQSLEYVKNGKCSVLPTITMTPSRLDHLDFTASYLEYPLVVAINDKELFVDSFTKISGKIGVVKGSPHIELINEKYPDLRIVEVENVMDGLNQLKGQELYGFVDILPVIDYHLRRFDIDGVKIGGKADLSLKLSMAVNKGERPEILSILNKALYPISNEKKKLIIDKWLSIHIERIADYTVLWRVIAVSILILSLALFYLRQARKHNTIIQATNVDLQKANRKLIQARDEIVANEKKYWSVINHQKDILLLHKVAPEGFSLFSEVNDAAVEFYGYTRKELMTMGPADVVATDILEEHLRSGGQDKLLKQRELSQESIHINKAGERIPVEASATIVEIAGEDYILSMIHNIRKRKQSEEQRKELEDQLRQKHKMEAVGYMAGGMAHNFNNNLGIILGNVELSQIKVQDTTVQGLLKNAKIAILRSRDLVSQIITYSRKGIQNKAPMTLLSVVDETIDLLGATLPTTINLQKSTGPYCASTFIHADASQVQEVLVNLCNNAVHAMNEKGELTISLEPVELSQTEIPAQYDGTPGHYAKLSVQDTGGGMPIEMLDKIFDPFFTTKEDYEGAGMGLATVQGIVAQHGGVIKVNSIPDQGTVFNLYFPIVDEIVTEPETEDSSLPGGTERILFVDDDETLASLGEQLLTEQGYQVVIMTKSSEALKMFAVNADRFNLVITDQTMPDLTGEELIQEVKKISPDMPTILCTGYSSKIDEDKAKELGINAFLMKPLDLPKLLQTVRRVLDGEKE